MRLSTQLDYRASTFGDSDATQQLDHGEISLAAAYAPVSSLMLSATVPLVLKRLRQPNLAEDRTFGLGDIVLGARVALVDHRTARGSRHLLGPMLGLRMPTAPRHRDEHDQPLAFEAQAGSGAWAPSIGGWYSVFFHPWSLYASSSVTIPTDGWDGARQGIAWLTSVMAQLQPLAWLALRAGVDLRYSARDRDGDDVRRASLDADSGGFVAFASPSLVASPTVDLLLYVTVRVPVVQLLYGAQREGPQLVVGATYDL